MNETPRQISLIPAADLIPGATEGVMVGAVAVYRFGRSGWGFGPGTSARLWEVALDQNYPTPDETILSGCLPSAGYSGRFTRRQADAYAGAVASLISAARKATQPKRDAKRASRAALSAALVAAAFPERSA